MSHRHSRGMPAGACSQEPWPAARRSGSAPGTWPWRLHRRAARLPWRSWSYKRRSDGLRDFFTQLEQFIVVRIVRRSDDDGIARRTANVAGAWIDDQAVLERAPRHVDARAPPCREGLLRGTIPHELDADQVAASTNIPDGVEPAEGFTEPCLEDCAVLPHSINKRVALDDALHRQGRGARSCVAGVRMARHERAMLLHDGGAYLFANDGRAQRNVAAGQSVRRRHDVGHDAIMLEGAPGAAPPRAAHHFIGDQQHVVTIADGADGFGVSRRCRHHTAGGADDGLKDESRHPVRSNALDP